MTHNNFTAIVKPTNSCNMACSYCYVSQDAEKGMMTGKTLETTTKKIIEFYGSEQAVRFLWHGGEPLLASRNFFERALAFQKEFGDGIEISNAIQTNGTLLSASRAAFFQDNGFDLGFSLDGDKAVHDTTRQLNGGRGSFDKVMKGIRQAKNTGGKSGCIAVITRKNVDQLLEIYEFFKREGINFKLNPLIFNPISPFARYLGVSPEVVAEKLIELFDVWFYDDANLHIGPMEEMLGNLVLGRTQSCIWSKDCQEHFMSIGPLGDVYPCGRFDGASQYRMGNINDNSVEEMEKSDGRRILKGRYDAIVDDCRSCEYADVCHGGCCHDAITMTGSVASKSPYCVVYRRLYAHLEKAIRQEAGVAGVRVRLRDALGTPEQARKIEHRLLRKTIMSRVNIRPTNWFFDGNHTDHSEYSKYSDRHTDHSEKYKEYACYDASYNAHASR
jgi:uncharacterized protein